MPGRHLAQAPNLLDSLILLCLIWLVTDVEVISLLREAIWLTIKLSAPALVVSLVVGLVISIIQTTTSIQEQTLTFVPKLMAVLMVLLLFASWMIHSMTDYTRELMRIIGKH